MTTDAAAGGSFDYAKAVVHAEYSYTVELRPSPDKVGPVFNRGFIASVNEITPAGEEMWSALREMLRLI